MSNTNYLDELSELLKTRLPDNGGDPSNSYVSKLFDKGPDAFLKKIAEEGGEVIMACKDKQKDKIVYEVADLWFHSMIALTYYGLSVDDVVRELKRRQGVSGIEEKASRKQ